MSHQNNKLDIKLRFLLGFSRYTKNGPPIYKAKVTNKREILTLYFSYKFKTEIFKIHEK